MKFKDLQIGDMFNTKPARWVKTTNTSAICVMGGAYPQFSPCGLWSIGEKQTFNDEDDIIALYVSGAIVPSHKLPTTSIKRDELLTRINAWLDQKRESTGGWAEITEEDINILHELLHDLIHLKCEIDPDGDVPIEYKIINRRTHERLNFQPVPYDLDLVHGQRRPIEGQLSILMQHWANLQTATSKFDTAMRCYEAEQRQKT